MYYNCNASIYGLEKSGKSMSANNKHTLQLERAKMCTGREVESCDSPVDAILLFNSFFTVLKRHLTPPEDLVSAK